MKLTSNTTAGKCSEIGVFPCPYFPVIRTEYGPGKKPISRTFTQWYVYEMSCSIWYHLYNLKNVESTHRGVLLLVKLQAKAKLTKSNTP